MATAIEYHRRFLQQPFGTSPANFYVTERRRRRWETSDRKLQGYAQFLMSGGFADASDLPGAGLGASVGAGAAAFDSMTGDPAWRAVIIGVSTGVLTFLINRWLGKVLG